MQPLLRGGIGSTYGALKQTTKTPPALWTFKLENEEKGRPFIFLIAFLSFCSNTSTAEKVIRITRKEKLLALRFVSYVNISFSFICGSKLNITLKYRQCQYKNLLKANILNFATQYYFLFMSRSEILGSVQKKTCFFMKKSQNKYFYVFSEFSSTLRCSQICPRKKTMPF